MDTGRGEEEEEGREDAGPKVDGDQGREGEWEYSD